MIEFLVRAHFNGPDNRLDHAVSFLQEAIRHASLGNNEEVVRVLKRASKWIANEGLAHEIDHVHGD